MKGREDVRKQLEATEKRYEDLASDYFESAEAWGAQQALRWVLGAISDDEFRDVLYVKDRPPLRRDAPVPVPWIDIRHLRKIPRVGKEIAERVAEVLRERGIDVTKGFRGRIPGHGEGVFSREEFDFKRAVDQLVKR